MAYIVVEAQNDGESVGLLTNSYLDKNDAENKYHTILAYAAKSSIKTHTAFMLTDDGSFIKSECYKHEVEPESEEQDG